MYILFLSFDLDYPINILLAEANPSIQPGYPMRITNKNTISQD